MEMKMENVSKICETGWVTHHTYSMSEFIDSSHILSSYWLYS